jgi:hypothetical protein
MRKIHNLLVAIAISFSGCSTIDTSNFSVTSLKPPVLRDQKESWNMMVGRWYLSQPTKEGGRKEAIMEHRQNGTYQVTFRVTQPDNNVELGTEVGLWGVSGNIYFSIFRGWVKDASVMQADLSDPYNYDAYRIIALNEKTFEYEHATTGNSYKSIKVGADFKFPELPMFSEVKSLP